MHSRLDAHAAFASKTAMAQPVPIATLRGVELSLGGAPLFSGVDLALSRGQRTALVGRNGAGKSTLLKILDGKLQPDKGEFFLQPGTTIRRLEQEPDFGTAATALDVVTAGLDPSVRHLGEAELDTWGVPYDLNPATASGGQARRIALARAFTEDPDILLLDEPTNHLDIAAIQQLEKRLNSFRGALLIVSHDRRFLENVSTSTAWLRQGVVRFLNKGYAHFLDWAESVEEAEERALDKLDTHLAAEQRWMARGVTARRKRNMGRVRKLQDMRAERRERKSTLNDAAAGANLSIETGSPSSRLVIEAKKIAKSFQTPTGELPIVRDFSMRIMRGDRVGLVGPNGSGKTTFLRLLLGELEPDEGSIRRAKNLEIAFLDQTRASLNPDDTLWEALCPQGGDQVMVRDKPRHVAGYAKDFLFDPKQLRQPVSSLSGGERNRLTLAIALARPCNLLVLDEPTNDLDIETLEMLEDMLADFDGTLLLVSHDRAFLDGVVTSLLTPLGEGRWLETAGGYADSLAQLPDAATKKESRTTQQPETPGRPARVQVKLSYKDQRRLDEIETLMPRLQSEITELEAALADPDLFSRDPKAFQQKAARLDAAREQLECMELEGLELLEMQDKLSGNPS